jgi:NAD(P)-dependent dehydrogenase (short-subunit alcohol dehydrogenase family)
MTEIKRRALVTGGNRGLGFALSRKLAKMGYSVLLTARDTSRGIQKTALLEEEGLDVIFHQLDVTDQDMIVEVYEHILKSWGRLDVLINNAGVLLDLASTGSMHPSGLFTTDRDILRKTLDTNVIGVYQMCDIFMPLMKKHNYGRIVNITSGLGQLLHMGDGYPAYRISKTALNAVTRIFSSQGKSDNVLVNSVDPGWVKTDMGGPDAPLNPEEGIAGIVWAATLPEEGPTGCLFQDTEQIPW